MSSPTINVPTLKNAGRQELIVANLRIPFGAQPDLSNPTLVNVVAAGVYPLFQLPQGAVLLRGYLNVASATTAATTVSIGTAGSPASILAATSVATVAVTAIPAELTALSQATDYFLTVVGTPVLVANSYVVLEYFVIGRAEFSQG